MSFISLNNISTSLESSYSISKRESFFSRITVTLLYFGIYLKDILYSYGLESVSLFCLATGILFSVISLIYEYNTPYAENTFIGLRLLLTIMCIWSADILFTQILNPSSYFVAPLVAILIINTAPRLFLKLILLHFMISIGIQLDEYITKTYFFIYEDKEGLRLDEKLFAGHLGVFRAKGLFQGPLSSVAFAAWIAFIYRKSLIIVFFMIFSSFLATGRLGLVIGIILFGTRCYRTIIEGFKFTYFFIILLLIFWGGFFFFYQLDNNTIDFILETFDTSTGGNQGRFDFWSNSLMNYLNYDCINIFFGNYGYVLDGLRATENDILRMLLDNGFFCFAAYSFEFAFLTYLSIKQDNKELLIILLIIFMMVNLFPFIQSLYSAILFWLFILLSINSIKSFNKKAGSLSFALKGIKAV